MPMRDTDYKFILKLPYSLTRKLGITNLDLEDICLDVKSKPSKSATLARIANYMIGPALVTAVSALGGEIADHIPYVNTTVPHILEELTKSRYFYGNLDKLAGTLGFISFCFRHYH